MAEESLVNLEGDGFHATPPSPHSDIDINPKQRLSSVLLNEFNYLPWERAVSLALGGRSKLGYVNGAIPMEEHGGMCFEWEFVPQEKLLYILDGDNVRHGLNRDLSFKAEYCAENIRRIGSM